MIAADSAAADGWRTAPRRKRRSSFYLLLTCAMTCTMFTGFAFTYFGPIARGAYPEVSPVVHVHGWSFFAWYMLLPVQAGLIRTRRVAVHRTLGLGSAGLGVVRILVGLLVNLVQIDRAHAPGGDPFWRLMGLPILSVWVLFTVLYVEAMRRRRRVAEHKRLMILASATALSAATFRIVVRFAGFNTWLAFLGMIACVTFPLVAIIHERSEQQRVHPIYAWGVPAIVLLIGATFVLGATPAGVLATRGLAGAGRLLGPLYPAP